MMARAGDDKQGWVHGSTALYLYLRPRPLARHCHVPERPPAGLHRALSGIVRLPDLRLTEHG